MANDAHAQTALYQPDPAATVPQRPVAVLTQSQTDGSSSEWLNLYRTRLRAAFLNLFLIYLAFLLRDLFTAVSGTDQVQRWLLAAAVVVQGSIALAERVWKPDLRGLAALEWLMLGLNWSQQVANQYLGLTDLANLPAGEWSRTYQILVSNTWFLPWFAVIAGYPILIPNSARRTAVIVGITAVLPMAVTLAASATNPSLLPAAAPLVYAQYLLWSLVGVSIAVYGAHQSMKLRREAFEAKQYGSYKLLDKIGGGGMGDVYMAEHRLLHRPSVIKLIKPDRARDPKMLKRFEREVRLLATLTHWNTVDVYDYGHTPDGTFYYVMEYLPGLDLEKMVARFGPLPPGRAAYLLRQICRGLREAHVVGLIHRDVKPSNVLVCQRGSESDVAKLLDFGLVRSVLDDPAEGALTGEQMIVGTPAYLSPEQACGKPVDARCDIYSLGATAYFLLTGKPPFVKERAIEMIAAHISEPPVPVASLRPEIPHQLSEIVQRCLAKQPGDRYADVRDLERDLAACSCASDWTEDQADKWWAETKPLA